MAAYSYLHPALFLDSANYLIQSSTTNHHHHNPVMMMSTGSFQEQACHAVTNSNTTSLSYYPAADNYQTLQDLVIFHNNQERSSCEENNSRSSSDTEQSLTTTDHNIHKETKTTDKKRKNINTVANDKSSREGSCLSSGVSKEAKTKKQRKCVKETEEKNKKENPKNEEPPTSGYIHVRARRGQATDSHSLAERVRREKISERMKLLQSLVPGCDKVTGKALMLDEIINYVQSLQNQVEFLSMKLASVNPIFYDYGVDMDALLVKSEKQNCSPGSIPLPSNDQQLYSSVQFQQSQIPNPFSQGYEHNLSMDMDHEQRDRTSTIFSQSLFNHLCSLQ
ncbi:hypothetical protein MKW94_009762 [Papaver nudicaule]|uniref:BHLH domain-containing protein n=1 Tax=Papaver nudicaule TaxID=74823 RepID=A0AA41W1D5_PAPNU|nr:hypothetical protein [Papaver nudicaule]